MPKHLFLLSPPLCGSTVIAELMRTSPHVTVFPGNGEGQFLSEAKDILFVEERWNPDLIVDWKTIKQIFLKNWNPAKAVRFEKSPPNIVRAIDLQRTFENTSFLVTIRNPYAQIEGLLRREWPFNQYGPGSKSSVPTSPKTTAEFWIKTAQYQKSNLEQLKNTCFFSYEELTENPHKAIQKILKFFPDIAFLDQRKEFTAHNITQKPIQGLRNLNQEKINHLSQQKYLF
jgi:hypothetical protein